MAALNSLNYALMWILVYGYSERLKRKQDTIDFLLIFIDKICEETLKVLHNLQDSDKGKQTETETMTK